MVEVFPNPTALSHAGAALFVARAKQATASGGRFAVALAGGSTPRPVYELLAKAPYRDQVPWASVHVFWGDERYVPHDDPCSNYRGAREALLDHVPIPKAQVHPVPFARDVVDAAGAYEAELRAFFGARVPRFDLVLLGMGADGHTASLFPGSPVVDEHVKWATWVRAADVPRVTLTLPVINQAAAVAFLVSGSDKATTLRRVLEHPAGGDPFPAQLIQPKIGELRWLVDEKAGSLLGR